MLFMFQTKFGNLHVIGIGDQADCQITAGNQFIQTVCIIDIQCFGRTVGESFHQYFGFPDCPAGHLDRIFPVQQIMNKRSGYQSGSKNKYFFHKLLLLEHFFAGR